MNDSSRINSDDTGPVDESGIGSQEHSATDSALSASAASENLGGFRDSDREEDGHAAAAAAFGRKARQEMTVEQLKASRSRLSSGLAGAVLFMTVANLVIAGVGIMGQDVWLEDIASGIAALVCGSDCDADDLFKVRDNCGVVWGCVTVFSLFGLLVNAPVLVMVCKKHYSSSLVFTWMAYQYAAFFLLVLSLFFLPAAVLLYFGAIQKMKGYSSTFDKHILF